MLSVEVVYATEHEQTVCRVSVAEGACIHMALEASGILEHYSLDVATLSVGVWSKKKALDAVLNEGDRIEIYRPLKIDPKAARRKRAQRTT